MIFTPDPSQEHLTRAALVGKAVAALLILTEEERRRVLLQFAEKYGWKI